MNRVRWSYNLPNSPQLGILVSSEGGEVERLTFDTHEGTQLDFIGIVVRSVYRGGSKHKF